MKLLVISDSHGRLSALQEVAALCNRDKTFAGVIHLGDFERDARYIQKLIKQPVYSVCGNCDWGSRGDSDLVQMFDGVRILMTHGHAYRVKMYLLPLAYRAQEIEVRAALFGHTHAQFMGYEAGVLLLNPGALQNEKCAVLTIEKGEISALLTSLEKLC